MRIDIETEVDIDVDDFLGEVDDDDLISEVNNRGILKECDFHDERYNSIATFITENFNINVSAYSNEELKDFIIENLHKKLW